MNKADFVAARNAKLSGELLPCDCGYEPSTYMDLVDHREEKCGIPRGAADNYEITGGDPNWKDLAHEEHVLEIKNKNLKKGV